MFPVHGYCQISSTPMVTSYANGFRQLSFAVSDNLKLIRVEYIKQIDRDTHNNIIIARNVGYLIHIYGIIIIVGDIFFGRIVLIQDQFVVTLLEI